MWQRKLRKFLKNGWGEQMPDWAYAVTSLLVLFDVLLFVIFVVVTLEIGQ